MYFFLFSLKNGLTEHDITWLQESDCNLVVIHSLLWSVPTLIKFHRLAARATDPLLAHHLPCKRPTSTSNRDSLKIIAKAIYSRKNLNFDQFSDDWAYFDLMLYSCLISSPNVHQQLFNFNGKIFWRFFIWWAVFWLDAALMFRKIAKCTPTVFE